MRNIRYIKLLHCKPYLSGLLIWFFMAAMPANAGPVYVELYTSQGCSSCPPADRILGALAQRDDVIALSFHVDYWDYIGWRDSFGKPEHSARQRNIARARGERRVYTPQMIINGSDDVIGNRAMAVSDAIMKAAKAADILEISTQKGQQNVKLQARALRELPQGMVHVHILHVNPQETVAINRGENAGRNLSYHNIVRKMETVDRWSGQGNFSRVVNIPNSMDTYAVFQLNGVGPVLGVLRLN